MTINPDDVCKNTMSIHIDIGEEASNKEAEEFFDGLAVFIGEWMEQHPERGKWDPFMYAHAQDCWTSDHCGAALHARTDDELFKELERRGLIELREHLVTDHDGHQIVWTQTDRAPHSARPMVKWVEKKWRDK